jgi:hypothetical protein
MDSLKATMKGAATSMRTAKTLSVVVGLVAMLAISATPASAWWRSTAKPAQTQGTIAVTAHGALTDGSAVIECPTNEIKAQWYLQTKGQIKEHQKNGKQEPTTEGPHLNIQIKWGNKTFNCKTKATGIENIATNVSACELQLVQQKGVLAATGGVVTTCVVTIGEGAKPLCVLAAVAGMEKQAGSNEGINVGLTTTVLENKLETNQFDKVEVEAGGKGQLGGGGIYLSQQGTNALCPVSTNESGHLKGLEFEAEKIIAI